MHMLGHHHETDHCEPELSPRRFAVAEQGVAPSRRAQQRQPPVAPESNEVQMVMLVIPLQSAGHDRSVTFTHLIQKQD
jgi:hypothetical protein